MTEFKVAIIWKYKKPLQKINESHFVPKDTPISFPNNHIQYTRMLLRNETMQKLLKDESAVWIGSSLAEALCDKEPKKSSWWKYRAIGTFRFKTKNASAYTNKQIDSVFAAKLLNQPKEFGWDNNLEIENIFIVNQSDYDLVPKSYSNMKKLLWISKHK